MRLITAVTFTLVIIVASAVLPQAQNPPAAPVTNAPGIPGWAYPVAAGVPGPKDDGTVLHVPNSTVGMTLTQARNASDAPFATAGCLVKSASETPSGLAIFSTASNPRSACCLASGHFWAARSL